LRKLLLAYFTCILLLCIFITACKKEQEVALSVDFAYTIVNNDLSAPVKINFTNNTAGATHYKWSFTGGEPATSDKKDPGTITFATAGNCSVTLEAWNDDNRNSKSIDILIDSSVVIGFDALPQVNAFVPADITIVNKSTGGSSYKWTFEGGQPATSTAKDPGVIKFTTPGDHTITLVVNNGRKDFTSTQKLNLQPALLPAFTIVPSLDDNDYEAPLTATLNNETVSGLHWKWTTTGGAIDNDTARKPAVYFAEAGTYTVTLNCG
jgi:PKD repeat protein